MVTNKLVKPFLKWAGGKRQLVNEIKKYIPKKINTYYEPFLGGGALLFDVQPKKAVVNDSNQELINCYRVIKYSVNDLIEDLKKHENEEGYYYNLREMDRKKKYKQTNNIERASRIIYLNKTCYNGLFRVNSQGQFNVPFGRYKNPDIVSDAVLKAVNKYLNSNDIELLDTDFEKAVIDAKKGDFVYLDPPYDPVSDTASFTGYDVNCFNKDEQKRVKRVFDELTERGCIVILSNAYTEFIKELYQEYRIEIVTATRAINSNASKRGKVNEVLVINDKL